MKHASTVGTLALCTAFLALGVVGCSDDSSGDTCADLPLACDTGDANTCEGNAVRACLANADGCLVWTDLEVCGASQQCAGGACVCDDLCATGASQCSGDTIQACTPDTLGCLEWADGEDCSAGGESCDDSAEPAVCVMGAGCGNDLIEGTEVCDGTDLGVQDCVSQGFASGTLACADTCDAFDTAGCVLSSNGESCSGASECTSDFCVDGVCCESLCDGACESCDASATGVVGGSCSPIIAGTDPDDECANGSCDGAGGCLAINGTSCGSGAECASGQCIEGICCDTGCGSTCESCLATLTGGVDGQCAGITAGTDPDSECASGVCNGSGVCIMNDGETCTGGGECVSGICVDGMCCDTACGGVCEACNVSGAQGVCTLVGAGSDPDNECTNGDCNGSGVCILNDGETCTLGSQCVSGNCVDDVCCDTVCGGTCAACDLAGTEGACTLVGSGSDPDNECTNGDCDGSGVCILSDGENCTLGSQCVSGNCVDDVCCDTVCGGACAACDLAGTEGACTLVGSGGDPDNECTDGFCNGNGACVLDDGQACTVGSQCISGNCVDDVCCNTVCGGACAACDLAGTEGACTLVGWGGDPDNDCTNGDCNGIGACIFDDGQACGAGSNCISGNCVDGVCCDTTCVGTCLSCLAAWTAQAGDGVCDFVSLGEDPDSECGGSCDGAGVCADICGDGAVSGTEACDDGDASNNNDCTNACTVAFCGDGLVHDQGSGAEVCDDLNDSDCGTCNATCSAAGTGTCDNGIGCASDADCTSGWCSGSVCAYAHTVSIDGVNDFGGSEAFVTTSGGYTGYFTWDETYLYAAMSGPDVNANDPNRHLLIYWSAVTNSTGGMTIGTQQPYFEIPMGGLVRWSTSNSDSRKYDYDGAVWAEDGGWDFAGDIFKSGTFVEVRLPWADIISGYDPDSDTNEIFVHMSMINATPTEWTYAGVPHISFADGTDPDYDHFLRINPGGANYFPDEADCADQTDDNYDGYVDCLDSSCAADAACTFAPELYIWEVDADNPSTDSREFIELYNAGASTIDFSTTKYFVLLVNGSDDQTYDAVQLTGTLAPGGLYLLGPSAMSVDIAFNGGTWVAGTAETNRIQNGPDGVLLVRCDGCTNVFTDFPNDTVPTSTVTFTTGGGATATKIDGLAYDTQDSDDVNLMSVVGVSVQYNEGGAGNSSLDSNQRTGTTQWTPLPADENDTGME